MPSSSGDFKLFLGVLKYGGRFVSFCREKRFALQTKIIILRGQRKNCNQILHNRDQNDMHSNEKE